MLQWAECAKILDTFPTTLPCTRLAFLWTICKTLLRPSIFPMRSATRRTSRSRRRGRRGSASSAKVTLKLLAAAPRCTWLDAVIATRCCCCCCCCCTLKAPTCINHASALQPPVRAPWLCHASLPLSAACWQYLCAS